MIECIIRLTEIQLSPKINYRTLEPKNRVTAKKIIEKRKKDLNSLAFPLLLISIFALIASLFFMLLANDSNYGMYFSLRKAAITLGLALQYFIQKRKENLAWYIGQSHYIIYAAFLFYFPFLELNEYKQIFYCIELLSNFTAYIIMSLLISHSLKNFLYFFTPTFFITKTYVIVFMVMT